MNAFCASEKFDAFHHVLLLPAREIQQKTPPKSDPDFRGQITHYVDPGNNPSQTAGDLMAAGDVRTVPDGTDDSAIATSIDLLTPAQDAAVHQPLFTIDGASAALGADAGFPNAPVCKVGLIACTLFIVSNASDSGQALDSVDIRWTDPNFLDGVLLDPLVHGFLGNIGGTCYREDFETSKISDASNNLVGSGLIVTFDPGCLPPWPCLANRLLAAGGRLDL